MKKAYAYTIPISYDLMRVIMLKRPLIYPFIDTTILHSFYSQIRWFATTEHEKWEKH